MTLICSMFLHNLQHFLAGKVERAQGSQRFHVLLVYFAILLDNLLLTVVGKKLNFNF